LLRSLRARVRAGGSVEENLIKRRAANAGILGTQARRVELTHNVGQCDHFGGNRDSHTPLMRAADWRPGRPAGQHGHSGLHRHPWLIVALSHRQPLGPSTLAYLEFTLAALEPTGLDAASRLETVALLNGFVANVVRAELADQTAGLDTAQATTEAARLRELLSTGNYPRFAAAIASGGDPGIDLAAHFDRLVDRMLDGLVQAAPET
jgi:hypothetical protein